MASSNDLNTLLTCSYCHKMYSNPVILHCNKTICRDDLTELATGPNTYKCPFCNDLHVELNDAGFQVDLKLQQFIDYSFEKLKNNSQSSESINQAAAHCKNVIELSTELKRLSKHSNAYIEGYFYNLRQKIDANRNANKTILDKIYDYFISELNLIEKKFLSNNNALTPSDSANGVNEQDIKWEVQANDWLTIDLKYSKVHKSRANFITSEAKKYETNLESKLNALKNSLLCNKSVDYEEKLLDATNLCQFGKLSLSTNAAVVLVGSSIIDQNREPNDLQVSWCNQLKKTPRNSSMDRFIERPMSSSSIYSENSSQFLTNNLKASKSDNDFMTNVLSNPYSIEPMIASKDDSMLRNSSPHLNDSSSSVSSTDSVTKLPAVTVTVTTNPVASNKSKDFYIVLFDYEPKTKEELTLKKGDILRIRETDRNKHGVWFASVVHRVNAIDEIDANSSQYQHRKSLFESFRNANSNLVCNRIQGNVFAKYLDEYAQVQNEEWFFGNMKRTDAEAILKTELNTTGSFLLRMCDAQVGSHIYSLSLRNELCEIKHYKIMREVKSDSNKPGYIYFIYCNSYSNNSNNRVKQFKTLCELIAFYTVNKGGLCANLSQVCSRDYV